MEQPYSRIYAEINLDKIENNMKEMNEKLPEGTKIIAVLKTDGYGHGAIPAARVIDPYVWGYAVAALEEAVILRKHGVTKPVLVLGNVPQQYDRVFLDYDIRPSLFQYARAEAFSRLAAAEGKKIQVHIALDTGMSRIGYRPDGESADEVKRISCLPGIEIEGLYTHFSRADETDRTFTEVQYRAYIDFVDALSERGVEIPVRHCANSAAIIDYSRMSLDAVRAGIAIYGLYPSDEVDKNRIRLKPAMEIYSFVTCLKEVEAGIPVSYGGTFVTERRTRIATVSAGYGDGYPRNLSGCGSVLIRGQRAPVLGRVCMDQFMVDVTDIPGISEGDRVTLVGRDGMDRITMEELARTGGGFRYEIPCVLGKRVPRIFIRGGKAVGKKDYNDDRYEDFEESAGMPI